METMEKEAILNYLLDPKTWKYGLYGLGAGSLGYLGSVALADWLTDVGEKIAPKPKVPEVIYVDVPTKKKISEKRANKNPLDEGPWGRWGNVAALGFGIPTGIYAAHQLLDYLESAEANVEYTKKLSKLQSLIERDLEKRRQEKRIFGLPKTSCLSNDNLFI